MLHTAACHGEDVRPKKEKEEVALILVNLDEEEDLSALRQDENHEHIEEKPT